MGWDSSGMEIDVETENNGRHKKRDVYDVYSVFYPKIVIVPCNCSKAIPGVNQDRPGVVQ